MVAEPDEPDWPAHEARAGELAAAVPPLQSRSQLYSGEHEAELRAWIGQARREPPEVASSLLLLLIRRAADEGGWSQDTAERVHGLRRAKGTLPASDAAYALHTAAGLPDAWQATDVLACAVSLAARADQPDDHGLRAALARLAESIGQREYLPTGDRTAILRRLGSLLPAPGRGTAVNVAALVPGDGWSAAVLAALSEWDGAAEPANLLIRHLRSATGRRPTKAWLAQAAELLEPADARGLVRLLLDAVTSAQGEVTKDQLGWGLATLIVSGRNADLLRAAAWAASAIDEGWVIPLLCAVVERAACGSRETGYVESAAVPAACVTSLGLIGSAAAMTALLGLTRTSGDQVLRDQVRAALGVAARLAGLGPDEVAELLVPDAGLDQGGVRLITVGQARARVMITPDWTVCVQWQGRREAAGGAPPTADAAARHAVRTAARAATDALAGELRRLECLLAQDRRWPLADWRALYCEHPVTGSLARALIWVIETPAGERLTAMPVEAGTLTTLHGDQTWPHDGIVRLWHPVRALLGEAQRWQDLLTAAGLSQPFSQAHREVYAPRPDERTAASTSRFAGQVLRYQQAHVMLAERGWSADFLGPFDGGSEGRARRDFPGAGLFAFLDHRVVGAGPADLCVELCETGQVTFHRSRRGRSPVRLARVPDVVFTEAMRDLGQLITATTVSPTAAIPAPTTEATGTAATTTSADGIELLIAASG